MKDHTKIYRMIKYLTEQHLLCDGGYPYAYYYDEEASCVWVAELDDIKDRASTMLVRYETNKLIEHYDRAEKYIKEKGKSSKWIQSSSIDFGIWDEAFGETYEVDGYCEVFE